MSKFDERLERDLGHIADRATPSPTAWEAIQTRIAGQADQPEMEIIMLEKAPPPPPRTGRWIMSAAAAVLLIVGGIVLLTRNDDEPAAVFAGDDEAPEEIVDEAPAPVEPEPVVEDDAGAEVATELDTAAEAEAAEAAAAVAVAEQFMAARNAYDGEAVRAMVADDAAIAVVYEWIDSPDDYPLLAEYEAAHGMRFLDVSCDAGSPGRVRCGYTLESDVTVALGVGPYDASFLFEIEEGLIRQVNHNRSQDTGDIGNYVTDVLNRGLGRWLGDNHPGDSDLMYDPEGGNNVDPPVITEGSVALWEQYVPEFIASLEAAAVDVATQFMEARDAHDADAVLALVAEDAVIAGADWVTSPDEYPLLVEFERIGGMRYLDPACSGGAEGRVRCTHTLESDTSQALGVGPFTGNSFLLVVTDGRITEVNHNFNNPDWVAQVDTPFRVWLQDNHPDDLPLLYESVGTGTPLVTADSLELWELRTAEFVAALAAGGS